MKDFLYSTEANAAQNLKARTEESEIFQGETIHPYEGEWGSLLVTDDHYTGFPPYEDEDHLLFVIGGPLFNGEDFLSSAPSLLEDWETMDVADVFDGPFVLLKVDKRQKQVECVTDLLSFIPVYKGEKDQETAIATHVDLLADALGERQRRDVVSEIDFILHGAITYPYTAYENLRQLTPGTVHTLDKESRELTARTYWLPEEVLRYTSVDDAATDLRTAVERYVDRVTAGQSSVAHFISGGEDSRTIAGLIPDHLSKDAFVFLDNLNLEGKIAEKSARIYGSEFHFYPRDPLHYLYILPDCSDLVGSGSEYKHAHTYGFDEKARLNEYPVVLGGLFSDAMLKGSRIKKMRGSSRFPFLPDIKNTFHTINQETNTEVFSEEILSELRRRRDAHFDVVKEMRPVSAKEWFQLWPASMNMNIPNLHVNRRLFSSYEPFMANGVVKLSASVPQKWKMNRILFHRAFRPYLKPAWWLWHSDGRFPYFSRYTNILPQMATWMYKSVAAKTGAMKGHQGPFADWGTIFRSEAFRQMKGEHLDYAGKLRGTMNEGVPFEDIFESDGLQSPQKINLLQVLHHHRKDR
ncbi:asparagine synthase-related protein [Salimicrobium sp. PL1-032A]|uniref:asparagine synthase-related protein n=1 Tax=Salimicrobium sp. PL1-032A TaxID=3095364 RepID=UPI00325FF4C2